MNRKIILHIVKDEKFFDGVFENFESDKRFENQALLIVKNTQKYVFKYIKKPQNVKLINCYSLKKILKNGFYDIIFFHSLALYEYKYFKWIPKDKIVIWWAWGYDIYHTVRGLKPLIQILLHKPLTEELQNIINKNDTNVVKSFINKYILHFYYKHLRDRVISRIDYFQPVIPLEYKLMCNISGFRAKEFYYPNSFPFGLDDNNNNILEKKRDGNILFSNSQSYNGNHLDVWESIKKYISSNQKVIIPLNYIGNRKYANEIANRINSKEHSLCILREFLPSKDYFELLNECSYAVFGILRQEAMGNIYYCLSHGIKVFLYKDSLPYRFFQENGYVVYSIEEINLESFSHELSKEEHAQNLLAIKRQREYIENIRNQSIDNIINS